MADASAGIDINANRMDTQEGDMSSNGFGNCLTRDGQGIASANLPMGGFRHTGVGNGVAASDYATMGQLQAANANWVAAAGTSDAITATYAPAVTVLTDGMVLAFRASAANLTTTPTFVPNGVGSPLTITKNGGQALAVGDIRGPRCNVRLQYDLANTRWELQDPPDIPIGGEVPYYGGTLPSGFVLPQGQNLSATTYPAANVVLGTTYGSPGGGNFTMPDRRGRTTVGIDASATHISGFTTLGATGGAGTQTIAQGNLPSVNFTHSGTTLSDPMHVHTFSAGNPNNLQGVGIANVGSGSAFLNQGTSMNNAATGLSISAQGSAASGGSGTPLSVVQPTLAVNVMMRIA